MTPPKFPRATRILTKKALIAAWKGSRDSTNKPGAKGVDGIAARQFKQSIDENISRISLGVKSGSYHFSKLRPFLIPKKDGKYRAICVPTVGDRLVQRTIAQYLARDDRLGLLNKVSYGFVAGEDKGVQSAIGDALKLRAQHEWALKTDIQSFFDEIDRTILKRRIKQALRCHSLVPFLWAIVDSEIRPESDAQKNQLIQLGLRPGRGLRQGMPLSPLLSNFVLAEFDRACVLSKKKIVRYADDIILFGDSKGELEDGFKFLSAELARVKHRLPDPGPDSKTQFVSPKMAVDFLGLEIVHMETKGRYVCRIPKKAKQKILSDIADNSTLKASIERKMTFEGACRRLSSLPSAYRSAFRQAEDWLEFEPEVLLACNKAVKRIFVDIFGESAISGLSLPTQIFLGIDFIPED